MFLFVVAITLNPNGLMQTWREVTSGLSYLLGGGIYTSRKGQQMQWQLRKALANNGNIQEDLNKVPKGIELDHISHLCKSWEHSI